MRVDSIVRRHSVRVSCCGGVTVRMVVAVTPIIDRSSMSWWTFFEPSLIVLALRVRTHASRAALVDCTVTLREGAACSVPAARGSAAHAGAV
jgi:hypothetical protein